MDPFVRFPTNKAIPRMPIPGKSIGIDLNTTLLKTTGNLFISNQGQNSHTLRGICLSLSMHRFSEARRNLNEEVSNIFSVSNIEIVLILCAFWLFRDRVDLVCYLTVQGLC
jgi:hypothetical protein